ncbi:MAG: DUF3810 family protein [Saprospiraceae bacterium]|nr:DUF3810 family protein [Saprospiraceae bacterium]
MIKFKNLLWVLTFAICTYILYLILDYYKGNIQTLYVKAVFESYRRVWDVLFSKSPIPLTLIWLGLLLLLLIYWSVLWKKNKWKWHNGIYGFIFIFCIHYIWFYWTWGFNYTRVDPWIVKPVKDSVFYLEMNDHIEYISKLRASIDMKTKNFNKREFEIEIRESLRNYLNIYGINAVGNPRCRYLYPSGSLLVWSAAGIYIPFSGESLMDPGLHTLAQAFTIPHELAHAFGVTHEAVCNFIAYKVCHQSPDPLIRYVAAFNYLKYLLADFRRINPNQYKRIFENLHPLVKTDLLEVHKQHDSYPEFIPAIRSWIYDRYLKSHGMPEGEFTYHQMVSLVIHDKYKTK